MTKVGLCGFTMSAARYASYFRVVEIQQTFYQPPAAWVIDRSCARMPPDFEFTLKAWMLITHAASSPTYRRLRRTLSPSEAAGAGGFQHSAIVDEAWRCCSPRGACDDRHRAARCARSDRSTDASPRDLIPSGMNRDH